VRSNISFKRTASPPLNSSVRPLAMLTELPTEVQVALAPLASTLNASHLLPSTWEFSPESFGNFVATFRSSDHMVSITRDRNQFIVGGADRDELEAARLWRAFDTAHDLLPYLAKWLGQRDGA